MLFAKFKEIHEGEYTLVASEDIQGFAKQGEILREDCDNLLVTYHMELRPGVYKVFLANAHISAEDAEYMSASYMRLQELFYGLDDKACDVSEDGACDCDKCPHAQLCSMLCDYEKSEEIPEEEMLQMAERYNLQTEGCADSDEGCEEENVSASYACLEGLRHSLDVPCGVQEPDTCDCNECPHEQLCSILLSCEPSEEIPEAWLRQMSERYALKVAQS